MPTPRPRHVGSRGHSKVTDKSAEIEDRPRNFRTFERGWSGRFMRNVKLSAKKLLPATVVQEVQTFRAYPAGERRIYLKVRMWNGLGLEKLKRSRIPAASRSIVFVCFGNIIRSPACEALMKQALADSPGLRVTVTSAGLNAVPGRAAHPWAIATAPEFGVSLEPHRARLLTSELVNQADAIFAMDYQNLVQLLSRWKDSKNKVFMLSAYAGEDYRPVEIRDPYNVGIEETRRCYSVLNACIRNLIGALSSGHKNEV